MAETTVSVIPKTSDKKIHSFLNIKFYESEVNVLNKTFF